MAFGHHTEAPRDARLRTEEGTETKFDEVKSKEDLSPKNTKSTNAWAAFRAKRVKSLRRHGA